MTIDDFSNIEFGISFYGNGESVQRKIPINKDVKDSLLEMLETFFETYERLEGAEEEFSPSEKYQSNERLFLHTNNDHLKELKEFYENEKLEIDDASFSIYAQETDYYFAIFHHKGGQKLIGVKRPNYFKGLLKKKGKLISLVDDTLKVIPDDVFKLDFDFDFVIVEEKIIILHPSGFSLITNFENAVLNSANANVEEIAEKLSYINFEGISERAVKNLNTARLIYSIKSRNDLGQITLDKLIQKCKLSGITLEFKDDKYFPPKEYEKLFLEILDRRIYEYDLTENDPEIYKAASRKKL
ncbi:MAG TPA: Kiwa anti-phage protein KwaB-like domain-containing protein [Leadbetterella sp.]|nr:Kiwa anti-phage protein KwaB-like domain-containing protein [Leadbetterella sp.]